MQMPRRVQGVYGIIGRNARLPLIALFIIFTHLFSGATPARSKDSAIAENETYERLFVLANTEFTLLHEIAHVLIWEKKPPVFGREEDAADMIAIMAQMMFPPRDGETGVIEKLQAVADGWKLEWQLVQEDALDNAYWDLHSLEIQRYYNIACLVYGADPEHRANIIEAASLPTDRAEWCGEEYALAKHAMDWLLTNLTPAQENATKTQRGKMSVQFTHNTTLDGEKLDEWLRESGIAERLAARVTRRFDLPRDIIISFENCPFPNAAWDAQRAKIQFCHSLLNRFLYLARELKKDRTASADIVVWRAAGDSTVSRDRKNSARSASHNYE